MHLVAKDSVEMMALNLFALNTGALFSVPQKYRERGQCETWYRGCIRNALSFHRETSLKV